MAQTRPLALVTGVGRTAGLGAAIATQLAVDGWDVATTFWSGLDEVTYGDAVRDEPYAIVRQIEAAGATSAAFACDLGDVPGIAALFGDVRAAFDRPASALIVNHTYCVPTPLLEVTADSFDRHLDVNVRAVLALIQQFVGQFDPAAGPGRIVTMTSDHTAGNVPYGVSKGAADRLTDAAAQELGHLGITANAVNPGPVDTGWMDESIRAACLAQTPLGRLGTPQDVANLVSFLCSDRGGWITGQLLLSNGGFRGSL